MLATENAPRHLLQPTKTTVNQAALLDTQQMEAEFANQIAVLPYSTTQMRLILTNAFQLVALSHSTPSRSPLPEHVSQNVQVICRSILQLTKFVSLHVQIIELLQENA
jgi:hypothetical protein